MSNFTSGQAWASGDVVTPTKLLNAVEDAAVVDPAYVSVLAGLLQSYLLPAGAIMPFAMNAAPTSWLACNGAAVSRATYANLFTAIGVVYGSGDGSTTFNLPDLRGYFLRGSGTNSDGTVGAAFGAKQADAFKQHNHGGVTGGESNPHSHAGSTDAKTAFGVTVQTGAFSIDVLSGSFASVSIGNNNVGHTHTINNAGDVVETRPKNIAMLFCIKV